VAVRRDRAVRWCGWLGIAGCLGFAASHFAAALLRPAYDPLGQTISELAVGPYAWVQGLGFCLLSGGLCAIAVGLLLVPKRGLAWLLGCGLLVLLAVDVGVVATTSETGSTRRLHVVAAALVVLLMIPVPWVLAPGLSDQSPWTARLGLAMALALLFLGPLYELVPVGWRGAHQRLLALLALSWLVGVAALLVRWSADRGQVRAQSRLTAAGRRGRPGEPGRSSGQTAPADR
jgi:hypothetical membrane protein